jgi:hypothetical protein
MLVSVVLAWFVAPGLAQNVTIEAIPHRESACRGNFVSHTLDHITHVDTTPFRMYDSNGSGLTIGDLNNDGLDDLVFANFSSSRFMETSPPNPLSARKEGAIKTLSEPKHPLPPFTGEGLGMGVKHFRDLLNLHDSETILWNKGGLSFRAEPLDIPGRPRAVAIIDLDADGYRDILFTSQRAAPSWWRNLEKFSIIRTHDQVQVAPVHAVGHFRNARQPFKGEALVTLVTTNNFMFNDTSGIYSYENQDGRFLPTPLADSTQALAMYLTDINSDGERDIAVGNDFDDLDRYWSRAEDIYRTTNLLRRIKPTSTAMEHDSRRWRTGD